MGIRRFEMVTFKIATAALVLAALTTLGCAGEGDDPTTTGTSGTITAADASPAALDADPTPVTCSPAAGTAVTLTIVQVQALDAVGAQAPAVSIETSEPDPTSAACSGALAAVQKLAREGQIQVMGSATNLQDVIPWDCDVQGQNCDSAGVSARVAVVGGVCSVQVTAVLLNVSASGTGGGPTHPHTGCNIQVVSEVSL
jgi:hypothetical protein